MITTQFKLKRFVPLALAGMGVLALPVLTLAQSVSLIGAGATFPKPLYDRYFSEYQKKTGIDVKYNAIGSGGGVKQLIAGTVDFGASDAAMTDAQIQQVQKGVVMVPTAGGAVAVVYSLPGVDNLKLSRTTLPAIFSGKITKWNDPAIKSDNPNVSLPDKSIRLAVRADSSGTSFIFTNHLSAIDASFRSRIGATTSPNWSGNPLKGRGNDGVAALIKQNEGTIGYVESSFVKRSGLTTALIQSKSGKFVSPSVFEANRALQDISFPDNFRVFEGDPSKGYPITGLTWLLIYRQYDDKAKGEAVKNLVKWILTDGQKINNSLEYTKIPEAVAKRVIATVESDVKIAGN